MNALDDLVHETLKQEFEPLRKTLFPSINDEAFNLLLTMGYRLIDRDGRLYMENVDAVHIWHIVFNSFPYIPSSDEMTQAQLLYSMRPEKYFEIMAKLAKKIREVD